MIDLFVFLRSDYSGRSDRYTVYHGSDRLGVITYRGYGDWRTFDDTSFANRDDAARHLWRLQQARDDGWACPDHRATSSRYRDGD